MNTRSLPVETAEYWKEAGLLGFALPFCESCKIYHFYPRPRCPECRGQSIVLREAKQTGTIYSYTLVKRAPSERFKADVPYVIAIIKTDDGPHLMSRIVDANSEKDVFIGMKVKVKWDSKFEMPLFESAEEDT